MSTDGPRGPAEDTDRPDGTVVRKLNHTVRLTEGPQEVASDGTRIAERTARGQQPAEQAP